MLKSAQNLNPPAGESTLASVRRLVSTAAIATLATLAACSTPPSIQTGEDAETIMEGRLAKVDNSRSALAYVDPDGDYSRFSKIWLYPLDLDNVEIIQPSGGSSSVVNRFNREWELTDDDKTNLQTQFNDSVSQAITRGGNFTMTEEGGKDVLRIDAMITRIAPNAPRDDMSSRGARSTVITEGAGSISVAMVLSDGYSGEVLAIIKDTRSSGSANTWTMNNSVSNMAEVRRIFNSWGTQLNNGLVALQERQAAKG